VETSAKPEAFLRGIDDQTGEPPLVAVQIDDQARAPLRYHPLRAAAFGDRKAGHSFTPCSRSSDGTPGLVSFGNTRVPHGPFLRSLWSAGPNHGDFDFASLFS